MSFLSLTKKILGRNESKAAQPSEKKPARAADVKKRKVPAKAKTSRAIPKNQAGLEAAARIGLTLLVTEKSTRLAAENGVVVFRVGRNIRKGQVAQAVRERYGVEVQGIRTVRTRAKQRARGRTVGWTREWKKAYVKVDDVQKIHSVA